jgi:hypothetical protein
VKDIAELFNSSLFEVVAIAQADECIDFKSTSVDEIIYWFSLWNEQNPNEITLNESALRFVVTQMKGSYVRG